MYQFQILKDGVKTRFSAYSAECIKRSERFYECHIVFNSNRERDDFIIKYFLNSISDESPNFTLTVSNCYIKFYYAEKINHIIEEITE